MLQSVYESIATRRTESLFANEMEFHAKDFKEAIEGSSIAVIGAAGSIGFAVVKILTHYKPRKLVLIDLNENNLVEVVRDLRSDFHLTVPQDFQALPIGLGSYECTHFFAESRPFDYVFNLSAVKHVRSEKDKYSLLRMIDTNNLFLYEFLSNLKYSLKKFFSVSTDKAVNPANLMGASKCVMESIMNVFSHQQPWSSARFANVAFSLGSLPHGFLNRIEKKQPLAAPNDITRYFISHEEAAQLCLLSGVLGKNQNIFFPKLQATLNETKFSDIAIELLKKLEYEPYFCSSEEEAKELCETLIPKRKWPCLFTASNTEGEKDFEEFYSESDVVDRKRFLNIGVVESQSFYDESLVKEFLSFHTRVRQTGDYTKDDYLEYFKRLVPGFDHVGQKGILDGKM